MGERECEVVKQARMNARLSTPYPCVDIARALLTYHLHEHQWTYVLSRAYEYRKLFHTSRYLCGSSKQC